MTLLSIVFRLHEFIVSQEILAGGEALAWQPRWRPILQRARRAADVRRAGGDRRVARGERGRASRKSGKIIKIVGSTTIAAVVKNREWYCEVK